MAQHGHKDLSPGIKLFFQMGNFFIMDSETLVSNAYHESQNEAINEIYKKNSITEKLTSMKNNLCERRYIQTMASLESQRLRRLKQLLDDCSLLRDEAKLIDLDKQRNTLEVRRRMQPECDFSYHDNHIINAEKRLGIRTAPCYLDRTQRFPVRLRAVSDSSLTPTVRRARASLRLHNLHKSVDEERNKMLAADSGGLIRAQSMPVSRAVPNTNSKRLESIPASKAFPKTDSKDRGSESVLKHHGTTSDSNHHGTTSDSKHHGTTSDSKQQGYTIRTTQSSRVSLQKKHPKINLSVSETNSRAGKPEQNHSSSDTSLFKLFSLEQTTKSQSSVLRLAKLAPECQAPMNDAHNSLKHVTNYIDDEYTNLPDHVDLQDYFFGDIHGKNRNTIDVKDSNRNAMNQTSPKFKRSQRSEIKLTADIMRAETDYIQVKVREFMKDLSKQQQKDLVELTRIQEGMSPIRDWNDRTKSVTSTGRHSPCTVSPRARSLSENTSDSSSIAHSDNAFSQPYQDGIPQANNNATSGHKSLRKPTLVSINEGWDRESLSRTEQVERYTHTSNAEAHTSSRKGQRITVGNEWPRKTPRAHRYGWRHIPGRPADGILRGSYSTEDLVLQTLTGIPIRNVMQTPVPLHTASRALRHTATYRIHKIVELLIKDRTRYQRHEVDELKRRMAEELQGKATVDDWATFNEDKALVEATHAV